jgi:hypothetical protein
MGEGMGKIDTAAVMAKIALVAIRGVKAVNAIGQAVLAVQRSTSSRDTSRPAGGRLRIFAPTDGSASFKESHTKGGEEGVWGST